MLIEIYESQALHRLAGIGIELFLLSLIAECLPGYFLPVAQQRVVDKLHHRVSCYGPASPVFSPAFETSCFPPAVNIFNLDIKIFN